MRRLNLADYTVRVREETTGEWINLPYEVKDSAIEILFTKDLQLTGRDLLDRDDIAKKIRDCSDGFVLLEEEEWSKLVIAAETIRGLGRLDVELVRRILEAPETEVEEKK